MVRASDAAPQLVKLRQAEAIGAVDDDGVRGRHVDAALDDGRAEQKIAALLIEVAHHALQLAFGHLAMGDPYARLGHQRSELFAHGHDGVDVVVQKIDLAAALELA